MGKGAISKRYNLLCDLEEFLIVETKNKIISHAVKQNDKCLFFCSKHGFFMRRLVKQLMYKNCPFCSRENQVKKQQKTLRDKNPFPDWFLKDLEGSPDKDKVLSLELNTHDYAHFNCTKHGLYLHRINDQLNGRGCPTCAHQNNIYKSNMEIKISEWLKSRGIKVECSYRNLIREDKGQSYELDLFLPDYNLAFEFNGYLFHSSGESDIYGYGGKSSIYHMRKTDLCLEKGVRLYHLWEDRDEEFIKDFISSKLGVYKSDYSHVGDFKGIAKGDHLLFDGVKRSIYDRFGNTHGFVTYKEFTNFVVGQLFTDFTFDFSELVIQFCSILDKDFYLILDRDLYNDLEFTDEFYKHFEFVELCYNKLLYCQHGNMFIKSNSIIELDQYQLISGDMVIREIFTSGSFVFKFKRK